MKSLIISLALAVLVVVMSTVYTGTIDKVSNQMKGINEEIAVFIENGDYDGAFQKTNDLSSYIEEKSTLMEAIGNHEELKEIELGVVELREFIRNKDKAEALSRCALLDFLFMYMPENYHLKTENIL